MKRNETLFVTSQEPYKSAPFLRLRISKNTSKRQGFSFRKILNYSLLKKTKRIIWAETFFLLLFITTQARHDCEKIAITGLEPASQDRSS